jgi:hypothetical protein
MKKHTICSAAIQALTNAGKPLSINELFDFINSNSLYQFKAKEPINILRSTIRKHTTGVTSREKLGISYFRLDNDGKYQLLK